MLGRYGESEAAPRMAYLPPDRLLANSDCIGIPVPGGTFQLVDEDGHAFDGEGLTGELVYYGPNVMMGYAFGREDLARSEEHTSELQSLMRISYAVFCLKKKNKYIEKTWRN